MTRMRWPAATRAALPRLAGIVTIWDVVISVAPIREGRGRQRDLTAGASARLPQNSGREATAMWDALWRNGTLATMTADARTPFGLIEDGAIAAQDGRIAWIGAESALPAPAPTCAGAVHDLKG